MMDCGYWIITSVILGLISIMEFVILVLVLVYLIKEKKPSTSEGE